MTEVNQIDAAVKHHLSPYGRFVRMQSAIDAGVPDFHYAMCGTSGWLEDKLIPASRRCPNAFTLDQLLWGEAEVAAGGRWHLLGLEPRTRTWMLFNVAQARRWFGGLDHDLVIEAAGPFPTKAIALALAPRKK
jgi:hypothetical protein